MPTKNEVEILGALEAKQKLEQVAEDLVGKPMLTAIQDACLIVVRGAKVNAPVDTGRLRASITPEIRVEGRTVKGVVGSNVKHAPYIELGTGTYAGNKPHRPPAKYLVSWARRNKTNAYAVAKAIGRRGGLKPRRYLQKAFDDNKQQIQVVIGKKVSSIINK